MKSMSTDNEAAAAAAAANDDDDDDDNSHIQTSIKLICTPCFIPAQTLL